MGIMSKKPTSQQNGRSLDKWINAAYDNRQQRSADDGWLASPRIGRERTQRRPEWRPQGNDQRVAERRRNAESLLHKEGRQPGDKSKD